VLVHTKWCLQAEIPYDKGPDFPFLLVGNKIDLEDKRVIQKHSAAKW
jgi:GTPase SAR1 family protein